MKQLIVSVKSNEQAFDDFKTALKKARAGKLKPTYEVSFDNQKDFRRFVENIYILSDIRTYKPRSIYELAKRTKQDVSNLNKVILFFEKMGVLEIKAEVISGRKVRRPIVNYDQIQFKLAG
jgi:predicted transcriptional regulator